MENLVVKHILILLALNFDLCRMGDGFEELVRLVLIEDKDSKRVRLIYSMRRRRCVLLVLTTGYVIDGHLA